MGVLIVQSLFYNNEFYVFRPIGNDNYKEVKFNIVKGEIKEDKFNQLHEIERIYIQSKIL
jgi:hypothetical protein